MCLDHVASVHGDGLAAEVSTWYGNLPGFSPERVFFIEQEGNVVSHLCVIDRPIRIGRAAVMAGEICIVGTVKAWRKQGYARTIVQHALAYMREKQYPLAFLFGIPDFYEKFGFAYGLQTFMSSHDTTITVSDGLKLPLQPESLVRPFEWGDLPSVQQVYETATLEATGATTRDSNYWRWLLSHVQEAGLVKPENVLVADHRGELAGYAMVASKPLNWSTESGALSFSIAEGYVSNRLVADALLEAAAEKARLAGHTKLALYLRPYSVMSRRASELGANLQLCTGRGHVRVIALECLLGQLKPALESRLGYSRFSNAEVSLAIRTEEQQAEIKVGNGRPLAFQIEIAHCDLGPLVTGYRPVGEHASLRCQPESLALLETLFPPQEPLFSMVDLL